MRRQVPTWLKPRTKKIFILEIISAILLLLLITGGILLEVNPLFRQQLLCLFCRATNTPAGPDIYLISQEGQSITTFASKTYLYTIDSQTGKVKHTDDLNKLGEINYQDVINGVSYILASNGVGSAPGTNDILLAARLSDGKTLWRETLVSNASIIAATSTVLYVNAGSYLLATNRQNGHLMWAFNPVSQDNIVFDKNMVFVQEPEQIYALRADSGKILWSHELNEINNASLSPVVDSGHVFFVSQQYQQQTRSVEYLKARIVEYDEKTGTFLWQGTLNAGEIVTSLHVENHYLLIEATTGQFVDHKLSVLRTSDKSIIWTYTLQSAYSQQSQVNRWIYSDDIVYGVSSEIDPQTFASNRVMRAWQISDGKKLFQISVDIGGDFWVDRVQNQLILTSLGNEFTSDSIHNDVEARQAQTGALLWHKHIGQLPAHNGALQLFTIDPSIFARDESFDISYYLPANAATNSQILYVALYNQDTDVHTLYALNGQNGSIFWQVNPLALNLDPNLHGLVHTYILSGATYVVTEFPTPNANSAPLAITSGPDGNLWFTESLFTGAFVDEIGRITPAGSITEFPIPNSNSVPNGITSGPDGNLWFTDLGTHQIGRITPGGIITEFPLPNVSSSPGWITRGPDGNLWFTDIPGKIGRITPAGSVTEFPLPNANSLPLTITGGPDGNLWFTESREDGPNSYGEIGRITPAGMITEFSIPNSHNYSQGGGGEPYGIQSGPTAITRGPDGNLWFTDMPGKIGRITPTGTIAEFAIPTSQSYLEGITSGPHGKLWFTETIANQIGQIAFGK